MMNENQRYGDATWSGMIEGELLQLDPDCDGPCRPCAGHVASLTMVTLLRRQVDQLPSLGEVSSRRFRSLSLLCRCLGGQVHCNPRRGSGEGAEDSCGRETCMDKVWKQWKQEGRLRVWRAGMAGRRCLITP